jgi:hypothetical protein
MIESLGHWERLEEMVARNIDFLTVVQLPPK